ncbi:progonadoliberin-1 [Rhinatrema bivittatum]|uniref:progonadoliberin-1 n=1 Tax=Rhinatrema bivittatum TaxID=194408 RepID=UPI00112DAAC2|nr:progonadoliberin-1 [Rhinatrema bivittatum]
MVYICMLYICRMDVNRKFFVSVLLLIISLEVSSAQHWSYGLRPGGKRDSETLMDTYQDAPNDVDKFAEPRPFECGLLQQHSHLSVLKGVLASLLEGETGRKKL